MSTYACYCVMMQSSIERCHCTRLMSVVAGGAVCGDFLPLNDVSLDSWTLVCCDFVVGGLAGRGIVFLIVAKYPQCLGSMLIVSPRHNDPLTTIRSQTSIVGLCYCTVGCHLDVSRVTKLHGCSATLLKPVCG